MIKKFISLEWKQFFRSTYWRRSLGMNIFLGLMALYLLLSFLSLGIALFYLLKEQFPEKDPLQIVNSYLIYWWLGDLIMRYMTQKLPTASVSPLMVLPIKKKNVIHYIMLKSVLSFWVFLPLMFFVPFAVVLWTNHYDHTLVLSWLAFVAGLVLVNNYLNYLINKDQKIFVALLIILLGLGGLDYFNLVPVRDYFAQIVSHLQSMPWLAITPYLLWFVLYKLVYQNIKKHLYFDEGLQNKIQTARTGHFSFVKSFGELGMYLDNDIKLILRNKRTKNFIYGILFIPLFGLIYAHGSPEKAMDNHLLDKFFFPAFYMTGIFSFSYGIYIPAWDSAHYPFLMSQKVNIKKYLESKWWLMTIVNLFVFVLTLPYIYYGWQLGALLFAAAMINIGYVNLFVLWNGAFNTKRIDLNQKATFNTQGVSGRNIAMAMLIMLVPMLIAIVTYKLISFKASIFILSLIGLTGIILKNYLIDRIAKLYIKKKYRTLHGFKQQE